MKTFKLFLGIIALSMTISGYTQTLTVASYNIRYSIEENHKSDSIKGEDWKRRGPAVAQLIKFHEFEMFGIQEGLLHQLTDLLEWLPGYQYVGVGRDDGEEAGEHTAVFYQAEKFKVLDHGDFWLSETPEKPSMGWDGTCCHRMCTWVYFEHIKSGEKFYFFNTHFDHQAVIARKESSKLILKKIKEIADDQPVIFMGDLNGDHDSDWYKTLKNSEILQDTYLMADNPYAQNGSFNGFGSRNETNRIIDHIFVSKHFSVDQWGILTDTYHGKFPSDHFPIMVKIRMK
jgi:endonuclease/exonuclease/phosphatase family metal-dependent hydrolase